MSPELASGLAAYLDEGYVSAAAARITRVSPRQLQYWDERGIVPAHQAYHRRIYFDADLLRLIVVRELRRRGLSLQRIRKIMKQLDGGLIGRAEAGAFLVVGRAGAGFVLDKDQVIETLKEAHGPMWIISLGDCLKRVARK